MRTNLLSLRSAAIGAVIAVSAAGGVAAWAHDGAKSASTAGYEQEDHHAGHHRHGAGGGFGGGLFMGSPERTDRAVDRLLSGLNATDAQTAQIKQIATAAATDLKAQREAGRGVHERQSQIFGAPVVDAAAAEQLRQQQLSQHDQASRRSLRAMLDVAAVLSPEQRATLAQRAAERAAQPHAHKPRHAD
jgi:periplasmic protein CpxP/Spy